MVNNITENPWQICFVVHFKDKGSLFLTDGQKPIIIDEIIYMPNLGLEFETGHFDESGANFVIIKGFFEDKLLGIDDLELITNIEISIYSGENLQYKWLNYLISNYSFDEMSFRITLASKVTNYSQQIVKLYSKTCRARFGDVECGINKEKYPGQTCDKSFTTCVNKYKNGLNFRGEPFIPTLEYFLDKDV
ncbi:MAG: phage BR0599 family protein [Rickettsiaceae bacterium]|nr:phage BR0599 family protein [Rickettsiaceae bacterium]